MVTDVSDVLGLDIVEDGDCRGFDCSVALVWPDSRDITWRESNGLNPLVWLETTCSSDRLKSLVWIGSIKITCTGSKGLFWLEFTKAA